MEIEDRVCRKDVVHMIGRVVEIDGDEVVVSWGTSDQREVTERLAVDALESSDVVVAAQPQE